MKHLYSWFLINIGACCWNVYLFGQYGDWVSGALTALSFIGYTKTAILIYQCRRFQLVSGKSDKFLT
jgi:hypothetical protein